MNTAVLNIVKTMRMSGCMENVEDVCDHILKIRCINLKY
jgi:hypothetical protein